jgi:enamine deaminase RidA (YjgF/YER057c/UK114 family)
MPQLAQLDPAALPEQVLDGLNIVLPPARPEDLSRVRHVGGLVYTPGLLPFWGEELKYAGSVDTEISVRVAVRAAQLCIHNLVAVLRADLESLDRVTGILQLSVLVRCAEGFENPARIADGASEALFEIFGSRGRHRRDVVGTSDLPGGSVVQVSAVIKVDA